MLKFPSNIGR